MWGLGLGNTGHSAHWVTREPENLWPPEHKTLILRRVKTNQWQAHALHFPSSTIEETVPCCTRAGKLFLSPFGVCRRCSLPIRGVDDRRWWWSLYSCPLTERGQDRWIARRPAKYCLGLGLRRRWARGGTRSNAPGPRNLPGCGHVCAAQPVRSVCSKVFESTAMLAGRRPLERLRSIDEAEECVCQPRVEAA